ncbi:transcription termination factor NusA [Candidatus Berkiella cookevillensis]|uniref:Transcription termination/antitermination protein NusA n=1 Tax=Candidatus Berkiella cookevillensis TaxID=437022 RepID=A0A0Q9YDE4_9GAMM|nr:transcription termination factor NusA [Candidatus Berkiella cookevillensis]MCS5707851.1 transcription termination factor NusA [Candidatus Berkiella cookevillensis]
MNNEIKLVVDAVSNEKNVPKEVVFEALEAALESATKKRYGAEWNIKVVIDRQTGDYETFRLWLVVDENAVDEFGDAIGVQNPDAELTLEQAHKRDAKLAISDIIEEKIDSIAFGRIAAQTAKQVIAQRLRAAKRDQVADEYLQKVGQLIAGTVKKVTRDFLIIELGNNAEALLKRGDMLPKEMLRIGDRVRAYLQDVKKDARGPQLIISRTCPEMLIELFKIEVPEIGDGLIELKAAARDPGSRAKIAVLAKDNRIDPIGACVGMRGARVQAVSNELGGERVDIVLWNDDPAQYVINSLAPAEVSSIIIDDDTHTMDVIVQEDQQSAAIGRNGQNVRLASHLTGWELNVISEQQAQTREQEEFERISSLFMDNLQINEALAAGFVEAGFTTIEEIAYVPTQELLEVEGLDEETLNQLRSRAKDNLLTQAIEKEERLEEKAPTEELLALEGMDKQLAYQLATSDVVTRDDLAELSVDDLVQIAGIDEEKAAKLIMVARAHWFIEN